MLGQWLQPGGDDDAVAEQIVAFRNDLTLVHTDPQTQPVRLTVQRGLDGDGALQRLHRAGELHQEPVAHGFEQSSVMRGRGRLDNTSAQRTYARQTRGLVGGDHRGIADDIRRQDAGKTALPSAHMRYSVWKRIECPGSSDN